MIFFSIITILFVAARVTVSFFFDAVSAEAATALTWGCIISGLIALTFIGVEIYCKITGKGKKDK